MAELGNQGNCFLAARGVSNKYSTDQKRAELYLVFVTRGEVVTAFNIAGIEPEVVVAVRQVVLGVDVV